MGGTALCKDRPHKTSAEVVAASAKKRQKNSFPATPLGFLCESEHH